ncbi:MAG: trigger factor [Elusimicrobia bacterium]|nr:trigger factor [Elusimicrobiota bacterium]
MASTNAPLSVKTKKLKEEGCLHAFDVELAAEKLAEAVHTNLMRIQQRAKVPGFRPGKAPIDIIRKQFSAQARADAADGLIKAAVPEALKASGLKAVVFPTVANIRVEEGKPLAFELRVETAPQFEVKGYQGLSLTKNVYPVTDEDVEKRLVQLQEGNARLDRAGAESIAKTHYAVLDYEILRDGKRIQGAHGKQELVDMSSDQTIEGLVDGLLGSKRGESREFPVKLEGKPASCRVTVSEIKEKLLPSIDDEFAKDMGFDALEALRAKLREVVRGENEERSERELVSEIERSLLSANRIPVPPTLAEQQLEQTIERVSRRFADGLPENKLAELREKLRRQSEDEVSLSFIMAAIAKKESLAATEEDVQKELEKGLLKAETEAQKNDVREFFETRRASIETALRDRKVMESIRGSAKVREQSIS